MLQFVVISAVLMVSCEAAGYGGGGGGGGSMRSMMGGYGSMMMGGGGGGSKYDGASMMMGGYGGMPTHLAVKSHHRIEYKDTPSYGMVKPTSIEVGAQHIPLTILFRSASSQLNLMQKHDSAKGSNQESESEDEPHYLKHTVMKPILQIVNEKIVPKRKIIQEVKPVEEMIETLIARKAKGGYGGDGMGGGMEMMYGGGGGGGGGGYGGGGGAKY